MAIVLVRHGETALNAARVMQPADTPLSARGRAQAAALAPRIAALRPAALLASDLPRAAQTAAALASTTGLPVATDPLLRERNFGDFRGRPHASFAVDPLLMAAAPPGGESMAEFAARVAAAWAAIVARRGGLEGPLIVVTHGLVIAEIVDRHLQCPSSLVRPARYGNTSMTLADAAPPHAVRLLDCTAHLEGVVDDDAASLAGG